LTNVTDTESGTTLNFAWNPWGDLIQKQETVGGKTLTTAWSYYLASGKLKSMTLPSLAVVGYGWGSGTTGGRITSMTLNGTSLISNISYFPFGGVTQWTLAQEGNLTDYRSYDLDGRIIADPVENIYYDSASRVWKWGLASNTDAGSTQFGYQDPMDWVSSYTYTNSAGAVTTTLGYSYDANANRTQATVNGVKTTYTVDTASNKLNSTKRLATTTSYGYDNDGSRTSTGSTSWVYDANEYLVSANGGTYQFDGLGERVYKKVSLVTTLFNYDQKGRLIGEYRGTGASVEETIYMGSMPVATLLAGSASGGTLYYVHADYRNTPRQIDNLSGTAVWAWTPQPYGENQPNSNPKGMGTFTYNLRYPGQYYDTESGLNYNMARTYDSATGRYLQSDPLGLLEGTNTYAYALSNPLIFVDPTGTSWLGAGLGGLIGGAGGFFVAGPPGAYGGAIEGAMWGDAIEDAIDEFDDRNQQNGNDCDSAAVKRKSSKTLRKQWEKENGQPWPKDPNDPSKNQDVSHIVPVGDGGDPNDLNNYGPQPHDDHMQDHINNGDFARWGSRSGKA
jgi:RHS repeat-associated protein